MKYKIYVESNNKRGRFEEFTVISHYVKDDLLHMVTGMLKCGVKEEIAISIREIVGYFTQDLDG